MADVDLQVRLNKRIRLAFTVGEDRTVELLFSDANTLLPIDLTGAKVTLSLPKAGGAAIKRRSSALSFNWSQVVNLGGMAVFQVPAHGFVTGDVVKLAAVGDGAQLPAPFLAETAYVAIWVEAGQFALVDAATGSAVALAGPATGAAQASSPDFTVENAALGQASCRLSAACTNACAAGQGQDYQIIYTDAQNLTRIFTGTAMLDVLGNPDYLDQDAQAGG